MTFANSFKSCYTSDEIPEGEMFTGWQTCKRTCEACEACSSRHIGFTFSRFQDLCLSKRTIGNDWRKLSSSFPLTSRNEFVTGIMGFVWGFWRRVALLFLIVCVVFFPTVACFTVLRCAQLILGKFLIVYRYSVLKSARYLLDHFFLLLFCSRDIFARQMSLGCSPSVLKLTWLKFARFQTKASINANSVHVTSRWTLLKFTLSFQNFLIECKKKTCDQNARRRGSSELS